MSPPPKKLGPQQVQGVAKWKSALSGRASECTWGGGVAGNRDLRKTAPHSGHQGLAGVLCSVAVQAGAGGWR